MGETTLSTREQAALAVIEQEELALSREGIDLQPVRFKINNSTQQFNDPLGQAHDEIRGIIVYKHKARGLWPTDEQRKTDKDKRPLCSSMDGLKGTDRDNVVHDCLSCPHNRWDTGKDGVGKACKEVRRVFMVQRGGTFPLVISLPPGSLRAFDTFISTRVQQGIADIMQEAVIRLIPATSTGGFTFAQAQLKSGNRVSDVGEFMQLRQIRELIKQAAAKMAIEDDDYHVEDATPAEPKEKPVEGDVF